MTKIEHSDFEHLKLEQTLLTFRVAADMFLTGRQVALKWLDTPPFIPPSDQLTNHLAQANPDIHQLTERQRSFLLTNRLMLTYGLMARRADYQRRWSFHPEEVKYNIVSALRTATEGEVDLKPERVDLMWGLFSVVLVAQKSEFDQAVAYYSSGGPVSDVTGFVSNFATELGRLPIVLRHSDYRQTIWHEDIHVWQLALGQHESDFDFYHEIGKSFVSRAAGNAGIQPADLKACQDFFNGVVDLAREEIAVELAASLWSRHLPHISSLYEPKDRRLQTALEILLNAAYSPAMGLPESQQMALHYQALMTVTRMDLYYQTLVAIAKQAMHSYSGPHNPWEWAASRATVMPPNFSAPFFKAVLLSRHTELVDPPTLDSTTPLAAVLATHARRKVHPDPYGQGEVVPRERLETFWQTIKDLWLDRRLHAEMLAAANLTSADTDRARQQLIRFASLSVPPGLRNQTKRWLSVNLVPEQPQR